MCGKVPPRMLKWLHPRHLCPYIAFLCVRCRLCERSAFYAATRQPHLRACPTSRATNHTTIRPFYFPLPRLHHPRTVGRWLFLLSSPLLSSMLQLVLCAIFFSDVHLSVRPFVCSSDGPCVWQYNRRWFIRFSVRAVRYCESCGKPRGSSALCRRSRSLRRHIKGNRRTEFRHLMTRSKGSTSRRRRKRKMPAGRGNQSLCFI